MIEVEEAVVEVVEEFVYRASGGNNISDLIYITRGPLLQGGGALFPGGGTYKACGQLASGAQTKGRSSKGS